MFVAAERATCRRHAGGRATHGPPHAPAPDERKSSGRRESHGRWTLGLIADGALALLQRPEQMERFRAEPGLAPSAVEELLRFVSPIQRIPRVLREDVEVGGRLLRRGEVAIVVVGAANRDPDVFADPDRLELGRQPNPHLAFGRGIHFCIGVPLARLEVQIALTVLLRHLPDLRLGDAAPVRNANTVLRSLRSLPVEL